MVLLEQILLLHLEVLFKSLVRNNKEIPKLSRTSLTNDQYLRPCHLRIEVKNISIFFFHSYCEQLHGVYGWVEPRPFSYLLKRGDENSSMISWSGMLVLFVHVQILYGMWGWVELLVSLDLGMTSSIQFFGEGICVKSKHILLDFLEKGDCTLRSPTFRTIQKIAFQLVPLTCSTTKSKSFWEWWFHVVGSLSELLVLCNSSRKFQSPSFTWVIFKRWTIRVIRSSQKVGLTNQFSRVSG